MTSEDFLKVFGNIELRQYIIDRAKRHSKRECLQEEAVQEAWLYISCAPAGYSVDAYKELARKAIRNHYWSNYKETILTRNKY